MILNYIIPLGSLIGSAIAIYLTAKRQPGEMKNVDADTIKSFQLTVRDQKQMYDETVEKMEKKYDRMVEKLEKRYTDLEAEFQAYKAVMRVEIADLHKESTRLRCWAERLCKQLRDNNIQPEKFS